MTLAALTLAQLETILTANAIAYEIGESRYGTRSIGLTFGRGTYHWFTDCGGGVMFDHSYSQIKGTSKRGTRHGWTVEASLEKMLAKLERPTVAEAQPVADAIQADRVALLEVLETLGARELPNDLKIRTDSDFGWLTLVRVGGWIRCRRTDAGEVRVDVFGAPITAAAALEFIREAVATDAFFADNPEFVVEAQPAENQDAQPVTTGYDQAGAPVIGEAEKLHRALDEFGCDLRLPGGVEIWYDGRDEYRIEAPDHRWIRVKKVTYGYTWRAWSDDQVEKQLTPGEALGLVRAACATVEFQASAAGRDLDQVRRDNRNRYIN